MPSYDIGERNYSVSKAKPNKTKVFKNFLIN